MNEEDIKKIIGKSTLETSDEFVNNLMHKIEMEKEIKKKSYWWSFRSVLVTSSILVCIITFNLFKLSKGGNGFSNLFVEIPKTPVFIIITIALLYFLNSIIKLNENLNKTELNF